MLFRGINRAEPLIPLCSRSIPRQYRQGRDPVVRVRPLRDDGRLAVEAVLHEHGRVGAVHRLDTVSVEVQTLP